MSFPESRPGSSVLLVVLYKMTEKTRIKRGQGRKSNGESKMPKNHFKQWCPQAEELNGFK